MASPCVGIIIKRSALVTKLFYSLPHRLGPSSSIRAYVYNMCSKEILVLF